MKVIGITGGIACGKSHVLSKLKELGAVVLDCDSMVKELSCAGGALNRVIAREFGREYITDEGKVDNEKLRERVFSDENAFLKLNKVSANVIRTAVEERIAQHEDADVVFVEGVRIFEEDFRNLFHEIWFVCCDENEQKKRLMERDKISREQAQAILDKQRGLMLNKDKADMIIETDGSVSDLYEKIERIYGEVK